MKANEEGLTKEEKIMFALLGIILIVAIGVLVVKNLSDNERVLLEETPITETNGQNDAEANLETGISESNLIEATPENVVNTINNTSNKEAYLAVVTKEDQKKPSKNNSTKKEDEKENIQTNIFDSWNIKETIVTKAYVNDTIKIDRNVMLNNGTEAAAQLTIRQLIDDTYMIVDISSGYLTLSAGTYKYYYTYAGITKEAILTVYDYLNPESVSLLKLNDEIIDDSITTEKYETLEESIKNTEVTLTTNKINLKVNETSSKNEIPIVLTLPSNLKTEEIRSNILGISITNKSNTWHQNIEENQVIAWINLAILKSKNINLILEVDGINYIVNLNIEIYKNNEDTKDDNNLNEDDKKEPSIEDTELNGNIEQDPVPSPGESIEDNSQDSNYENNTVIAVTQDIQPTAPNPS